MTPEEAGEKAARDAESWIRDVLSGPAVPGAMEERNYGPPGDWSVNVMIFSAHDVAERWRIMAPRHLGGPMDFMGSENMVEETVGAVRKQVTEAVRQARPYLRWMAGLGLDLHEIADEVTVAEVMES